MNTQKILSIGFGAAAFAGVLGGGSVLAAGTDVASVFTDRVGLTQQADPNSDARKAEREAYLQSLATRLGVSVDTLKTAIKDTSLEKLAQMVTDGKLTQAQADAIKAEIEAGDHLFFGAGMRGPKGGHGEGRGGPGGIHMGAGLATFLGIDEAALRTELQSGKTLATIAQEHGKSRDELKAYLTEQLNAELAEKVAAGKITQEQADARKAEATANLDAMIDGSMQFKGPKGGHGGPGRMAPPAGAATQSQGA